MVEIDVRGFYMFDPRCRQYTHKKKNGFKKCRSRRWQRVGVLPVEVEIPSMRVLIEAQLSEAEWCQSRYDQLNLIEEKRMKALCSPWFLVLFDF